MRVIVAAAGTGGHINPAIAIANKIKRENKKSEILFVGTNRGLENDLVPRAGFELKTIEAHGLSKKISIENIQNMMATYRGIKQAEEIIKKFKPDIVVGTGGYICGPVFVAAQKLKIPTAIHESNAFPGTAVKMLAPKVNTVLVGFKDAKDRIKNAKKVVVTGNPTKIKKLELTEQQKNEIKLKNGITTNLPIVLVFGGSQGAKAINDTLLGIIKNKLNEKYQIIWAAGPAQFNIIQESLERDKMTISNIKNTKIVPYIYNMEEIMNISDVVIARSGAMTITEVAIVGKPAIFIPLPNVSQNHQEYNAKVLVNAGAAEMILNSELNDTLLHKSIERIISNTEKMKKMGEAAEKIAVQNVEDRIYQEFCNILANDLS